MKKRLIIIVTILAVAALTTAALAQGPQRLHERNGRHGAQFSFPSAPGFESHFEHLQSTLDLTEDQETAIEAILERSREEGVELRKQQARIQNQIDGEMLADAPSQQKLVDLTEQLGGLRTELQVIRLKARLAVRAELTDEQRDQLVLMGDRRSGRGRGRHAAPRADTDRMGIHRRLMFEQESDDEI